MRLLNERPEPAQARHVLYWAQMNRRADSNHGLEFAASMANDRKLPLLVYEGLTCTYPYASDRFHQFILEAVPETARRLRARGIGYVFYLRRRKRDANDALYRLAKDAAAVVTDDYPTFIAAGHNRRVPDRVAVPYYVVDSSCVVPMRLLEKKEYAAYTIRPRIHRMLDEHMRPVERVAVKVPYKAAPPEFHTEVTPEKIGRLVASCEIDHGVKPSVSFRGGAVEGERRLRLFLNGCLSRYEAEGNEPSAHATSNLSPWLHFGHVSALRVALEARLQASENDLDCGAFLEELIVRRELAFNHCRLAARADSLSELPDWARKTLDKHAGDQRDHLYTREQFEHAQTHDELWNATQTEMLLRGKIHGYYRMYWGKKVMEWSGSAQEALETMVYLHDRYALDGRDPNTYTNILWCFGLHDRPWKERPVFGMVRYMSLGGMKRKTGVPAYLEEIRRLGLTGEDPYRLQ